MYIVLLIKKVLTLILNILLIKNNIIIPTDIYFQKKLIENKFCFIMMQ